MDSVFRTLDFEKRVPEIARLGYRNLIVSGCSYTWNWKPDCAVTWPYFLRDMGGFERVLDTSMPGAGNYHIASSLQWALESDRPDPESSLVVVMWSGNDRDDLILPHSAVKNWVARFDYTNNVSTGITGGLHPECVANLENPPAIKNMAKLKSAESRAIENFLIINGLYHYLSSKKYPFVFLNHFDPAVPNRTRDFPIDDLLPHAISAGLRSCKIPISVDLYVWALERNYLMEDHQHITPQGHHTWTEQILLPAIRDRQVAQH